MHFLYNGKNFIYGVNKIERINSIKTAAYNCGFMEGYRKGILDCMEGRALPGVLPDAVDEPLQSLNLSNRSFHCLERQGFQYIRDIIRLSKEDIWNIRNMGKKSACEIAQALVARGILDSDWNHYLNG